jgi:YidC/Oxa1 family membrane protein insertase
MRSYGRKVQKVKPKLTALQEKYAKNPKRLREEQMKLYRENGVGFPSGCIMMLIQIPIFFSLFSALRVEYSIRGETFLWIKDLAGPDRLVDFGSTLVDLGIFRLDALNLLPILMVILSIWHTRSMPKPADDQQAQQMKMMKWMPIFFAFILYNYTAALALYMVFSSAIALIEAKIVRAKDAAAEEADKSVAVA